MNYKMKIDPYAKGICLLLTEEDASWKSLTSFRIGNSPSEALATLLPVVEELKQMARGEEFTAEELTELDVGKKLKMVKPFDELDEYMSQGEFELKALNKKEIANEELVGDFVGLNFVANDYIHRKSIIKRVD